MVYFVLKFLLSASKLCSKYSRAVMKKISNETLTRIFFGGSLKCFGMDKGVLEIDAKEVRKTKKSKKKIKRMYSFSFLTETPFSKLK